MSCPILSCPVRRCDSGSKRAVNRELSGVVPKFERVGLERRLADLRLVHRYALPLTTAPPGEVSTRRRGVDIGASDHVVERILRHGSTTGVLLLLWVLVPVPVGRVVGRVRVVRRFAAASGAVRVSGLLSLHCPLIVDGRRVERAWSAVDLGRGDRDGTRVGSFVEHRHVLRQASVDGHFVGSLDASVDPKDEREPEQTADRDADTNDNVAVSGAAGARVLDGLLRVGHRVGRSEREGGVDMRGQLPPDTILGVQGRVGCLEVGIERLKVLRRDIGEPLREELGLVTVPGCGLVDCQTVRLDLGC